MNQCVYFFGNFLTEIIICTSSYNYVILDLIFYIFFPSIILFKHTKCVYFCTYIIFIKFVRLCSIHISPSVSSDPRLSNGTLWNWPSDITLNILYCIHRLFRHCLFCPLSIKSQHMLMCMLKHICKWEDEITIQTCWLYGNFLQLLSRIIDSHTTELPNTILLFHPLIHQQSGWFTAKHSIPFSRCADVWGNGYSKIFSFLSADVLYAERMSWF